MIHINRLKDLIKGKSNEIYVSRLSIIRITRKICPLIFIITIVSNSCISCFHDNSWQFRVKNQTEDTLVITTELIIPDFGVQVHNFDYLESDPRPEVYNYRYVNVSDTIFTLPPDTEFGAWKTWTSHDVLSDNPEADGVTPGWKFIKRMELGGRLISPNIWNSEQKWRITWEYEDVERAYSLTIDDAHLEYTAGPGTSAYLISCKKEITNIKKHKRQE